MSESMISDIQKKRSMKGEAVLRLRYGSKSQNRQQLMNNNGGKGCGLFGILFIGSIVFFLVLTIVIMVMAMGKI